MVQVSAAASSCAVIRRTYRTKMLGHQLLKTKDVAEKLAISPSTVRRLAASGDLTPIRIGGASTRYRLSDVEALIDRGVRRQSSSQAIGELKRLARIY